MRDTKTLPTGDELQKILDTEARRELPHDRVDTHFVDFSAIDDLFDALEINARLSDPLTEPLDLNGLMKTGDELLNLVITKLLGSNSQETTAACERVYSYLSETDPVESADLILVFGARTPLRIERAVELFKSGYGSRLLVSGHAPLASGETISEAERYRDYALTQGIPAEAILLENRSITIPDNVRCSLNLLDENDMRPKSVILVNSPYVQRRGYAHMQKYAWPNTKIIRQNCGTAEKYRADQWYKSADGIKVVLNEFFKLKIAVALNSA